jgi:hypothetical protein
MVRGLDVLKKIGRYSEAQLQGAIVRNDPHVEGCYLVVCPEIKTAFLVYVKPHQDGDDFEVVDNYEAALDYLNC